MDGAKRAIFIANAHAKDGAAGVEGSYWTIMGQDIAAALAVRGHQLSVINIAREDHRNILFPMLLGGPAPDAFVLFNFLPKFEAPDKSETGLMGKLTGKIVCICLDHPIHLAKTLREQAALIAAHPALRTRRWFGVMEPSHMACVESLGFARERIFVMGQGGPPLAETTPLPLAERSIPFLFAGTIGPMADMDAFAQALRVTNPDDRAALDAAIAETIDGKRDVFEIVRDRFAPAVAAGRLRDVHALAATIDKRARQMRRRRLLLGLRHLPIQFCGDIDPGFLADFPNAKRRGRISFADTLALMRDTRVVINDTINLRQSALIRFFYAAGEGCVLASETNPFIAQAFPPGEAMIALDGRGGTDAGMLTAALDNPVALQSIADRGRALMGASHTWAHRIDGLVAALEG